MTAPLQYEPLLDVVAIAAALRVHRSTVHRWVAAGLVERGRRGSTPLYSLDEAIEAQRHAARRMRHEV